jgi:predicted Rdx family selenoprotein
MRMTEMIPTSALQVKKTRRSLKGRTLTSGDAGKILPLKYEWLHREDGIQSGKIRINVEMQETAELLMNGVGITTYAHFVPMLAFERFGGSMHELNLSYKGENGAAGTVVPFFETTPYSDNDFYQTMGIHHGGATINSAIVEAYNCVVNYRRKARSKSLPLRSATDHTLAEAFWINNGMQNIVPDFDQKLIDGSVALSGLDFTAPVYSTHKANASLADAAAGGFQYGAPQPASSSVTTEGTGADAKYLFDGIWAEMSGEGGLSLSLQDIERAKKTASFAKLRSMYDGIDDEYIIDLLMSGIRVPDESMKQPILLAKNKSMIGFNQRYATDGASLDTSATNGYATIDMNVRCPSMNTGGILIITAEIVPEQLYERKKDYFLGTTDPDTLPQFLRDELDPEKVAVVRNDHADVNHATPDGTFGYAPLNHQWQKDHVNVGGKYYRPDDDAFDEDRAKIWTAEAINPTLNEDFYLVSELHKKVFSDQISDSFEITALSSFEVVGNTVFGQGLLEADATSDYDAINDQVDSGRIEK